MLLTYLCPYASVEPSLVVELETLSFRAEVTSLKTAIDPIDTRLRRLSDGCLR